MFAIRITEKNLEKIHERLRWLKDDARIDLSIFVNHERDWYFIDGYFEPSARFGSRPQDRWGILPAYIFLKSYDYDAEKIQTDWDQIVRLP